MRSSPKVLSAGLAVTIVLLSFAFIASAGPKEDVAASSLAWGRALGEDVVELAVYFAQFAQIGDAKIHVAELECSCRFTRDRSESDTPFQSRATRSSPKSAAPMSRWLAPAVRAS